MSIISCSFQGLDVTLGDPFRRPNPCDMRAHDRTDNVGFGECTLPPVIV